MAFLHFHLDIMDISNLVIPKLNSQPLHKPYRPVLAALLPTQSKNLGVILEYSYFSHLLHKLLNSLWSPLSRVIL